MLTVWPEDVRAGDAGAAVAMDQDDDLPSRSRRRMRGPLVSGASTLLAIVALLAVWAVLVTRG